MFFMEPPVLPDFDGSSRMHQEECEEDQDQDHYRTNTNTPPLVHRAAWYVPVDGSGPDDGSSNESSQVSRSPLEEWQCTSHAGYQPQYAWNIGEQPRHQSYGIDGIGALGLDPQHANIMPTAQRTGRFLLFFFFFFLFFFFPNNRARSLYLCPSAAGGFIATFFLVQRPTIRLQRQGKEETWQRPTLGLQRQGSEGIPRAQEA
jgi:hypothetical protein